jgi:hypothetical protein
MCRSMKIAVALAAAYTTLTAGVASAQWSRLDPFNKNSDVRRLGRDVDRERREQMESVAGGRFEVTIRNPGRGSVYYSLNGKEQIVLLGGMKRTHSGVGKVEIRFDRGLGNNSVFAYNLSSGQSYSFKWVDTEYPEWGRVRMLNLYKD